MTDQPRDPKQVPPNAGAQEPTVEQPTPAPEPAAAASSAGKPPEQAAASAEHPAVSPAGAADQPAVLPAGTADQPAVPPAGTADQTAVPPAGAADQTAAYAQQPPPPTPQLSQPGPGQSYAPWGPPAAPPARSGGFRRFVGHRATQLVAVGVLGLVIGGGVVGAIAAASHHGRDGRPGISRQHNGPGTQGSDGRAPGFGPGHRGGGNPGNGSGI